MQTLIIVNQYIKFIYILLILSIIIVLFMLLRTLLNLGRSALRVSDTLNNIAESADNLSNKVATIDKQCENSIPWFAKKIAVYSFVNKLRKDIRKLRKGQLSKLTVILKTYQYQKTLVPFISKIIKKLNPSSN